MADRPKLLAGILALAFLAAVLAWFAGVFHPQVSDAPVQTRRVDGDVVTARLVAVPQVVPVPGTVSPTDETVIGSRLLATVTRVHVRAGSEVAAGDPLVEFDAAALRAALQQREQAAASARAAMEEAARNRDRAIQLLAAGSLSQADRDRALTNARVAETEVERTARAVDEARTQLDYTALVAPIAGRVVERFVDPGDTATPGQPLLKLFNPGRMRVEAVLPESLIRSVQPGDRFTAHIDALDREVDSTVEEIVPSADPGSRTFRVKALLPPMPDLYPGMFARLDVPVGATERLLVPEAAIEAAGQLRFVWVRGESGDERRAVRTGAAFAEGVEVVSGLVDGEQVVVSRGT